MSTEALFANYEVVKLSIPHPTLFNLAILLAFAIATIATLRKPACGGLLDISQSVQLKGAAMILVVTGHLWVHVSEQKAVPVLSDYAVSVFMFLSGFGLHASYKSKSFLLAEFARRRMSKVLLPYWAATALVLALDWQLLGRTYSASDIALSLAGVNYAKQMRNLDYVRWFISLLLTFYISFAALRFIKLKPSAELVALFAFAAALVALRFADLYPFGQVHQIMAFPLGFLASHHHAAINKALQDMRPTGRAVMFAALVATVAVCGWGFAELQNRALAVIMLNLGAVLFIAALVLAQDAMGKFGNSLFLGFVGGISYELFLLHGPFMIKYNPVFNLMPTDWIIASYLIWFAALALVATLFKSATSRLTKAL